MTTSQRRILVNESNFDRDCLAKKIFANETRDMAKATHASRYAA